jgi:quinol monooxygenase YgiN
MFVVVARWYSKEEKEQDVREILQTIVKESLSEPGCIYYIANLAQDDPRRILIYEQYQDEAAFKEHIETRAFKEYVLGRAIPLLDTRSREIYTTIG